MSRRLPAATTVVLEQRRLFIFPTRAGFVFLLALVLLLLTAINYQNNMAYALTFWLAMTFIIAVHITHSNLMHLRLSALSSTPVFPRQRSEIQLQLQGTPDQDHCAVRLIWSDSDVLVDVPAGDTTVVSLFVTAGERGWYSPPRLRIESTYPLGLLRCWTFADLALRVLVWPTPLPAPEKSLSTSTAVAAGVSPYQGTEDLLGFRNYRPGDSLRHIDWRSWARQQPLQTRLLSAPIREDHWLNWEDYPQGDTELRLSWLCDRVLSCDAKGSDYGLRLPGLTVPMGQGDRQRETALRALALFAHEASPRQSVRHRQVDTDLRTRAARPSEAQ